MPDLDSPPPVRPLSLRSNFLWSAAGNGVYAASHGAMLVLLAKLGHIELVGPLVLAFAVCGPIYALAELGLRSALITDARREFRFSEYLAVRLLGVALAFVAAGVAAVLDPDSRGVVVPIAILAVGKGFESVSDIFQALFQQQERMDRSSISLMLRGVLTLAALGLGVHLTGSLAWGFAGYALAAAVSLAAYDIRLAWPLLADATATPERHAARQVLRRLALLAWTTLPLGVVMLALNLITNIPRYSVGYYLGTDALGVFGAIFSIAKVGTMVVGAVGQAISPRLAKYHAAGQSAPFYRVLGKFLVLTTVVGLMPAALALVWGGPLLALLFDPSFAPYADLAVWLMVAGGLIYLTGPLGRAVDATRRFWTHLAIRGTTVVMLALLCPPLTAWYGLHGTAWATLAAVACSLPFYFWAIQVAFARNQGRPAEGDPQPAAPPKRAAA